MQYLGQWPSPRKELHDQTEVVRREIFKLELMLKDGDETRRQLYGLRIELRRIEGKLDGAELAPRNEGGK